MRNEKQGLSEKRKRFVAEYLVDLNATQAAIRAGYSPKTAQEQASRLLSNVMVREALEAAHKQRLGKLEITAERVLEEIACLAYSDIADYVREDGTIDWPLIKGLPRQKRAAIQKLIVDTTGGSGDGERRIVERTRFECANKLQALELLGRHLKLFTDRTETSGPNGGAIPVSLKADEMSLAELAEEIRRGRSAESERSTEASENR